MLKVTEKEETLVTATARNAERVQNLLGQAGVDAGLVSDRSRSEREGWKDGARVRCCFCHGIEGLPQLAFLDACDGSDYLTGLVDRKALCGAQPIGVFRIFPGREVPILEAVGGLAPIEDWLAQARARRQQFEPSRRGGPRIKAREHEVDEGVVDLLEESLGLHQITVDRLGGRQRHIDGALHEQTDQRRYLGSDQALVRIELVHVLGPQLA